MREKNTTNEIKKLEGSPKVVKIFSDDEIEEISNLYNSLPITTHNKAQNVIKKRWLQNYNKSLDKVYVSKIKELLGDYQMDNFKSEKGDDFFGLFHESFSPLKLHVDSGFEMKDIIYKQVVTPLSPIGETVIFKNKWYGKSASFTIDEDELKFKPKPGQNARSCEHLGTGAFDREIHQKYLTHLDINNLNGLKVELVYEWKVGEILIMDRSHIHCSSSRIENKKLGLTTFTKKK
jgi:hypothetical protein